jgi:dolichol-phosphate mannosyltransferase
MDTARLSAILPAELAIVVPAFNERQNVGLLVEAVDRALGAIRWEMIFVDDNSPDGTAAQVREIALTDPRVRVVHRFGRRGLATACIEGIMSTAAPYVAVMDADLQHDEAVLPEMFRRLTTEDVDLVVGSRYVQGGGTGDWGAGRVRLSRIATRMAARLTRTPISDPMSGFFMLRTEILRGDAHRLSGVGFKILLDILATVDNALRVKEFPLHFAARAEGESKLDRTVVFEFLVGLYDRWLGRIIPTRFALFGTIGAVGVLVHMAVLATFLNLFGGGLQDGIFTVFEAGQTVAAVVAMTFNFFLNNALTYADKRLSGFVPLMRGWAKFGLTCSVGLLANVGVAAVLVRFGFHEYPAAITGIIVGSVWNFALSSKFVWGRY